MNYQKSREFLKKIISSHQIRLKLRKYTKYFCLLPFFRKNLNIIGFLHGTDKCGVHSYTTHYMTHLKKFRLKRINLLEIGVGGYDSPILGGESLRMWKSYFLHGKIYGVDIYDKSPLQERRIKIFKGSQVDKGFMCKVIDQIGEIDIIIDDGSHINNHVIETFNHLFPKLKNGGVYVIEDTQTSYWESCGGDSKDLNNPKTTMNFFKNLTDSLNCEEFLIPDYKKNYFDETIISMHFYHNMIFVYKGDDDKRSNIVVNNSIK